MEKRIIFLILLWINGLYSFGQMSETVHLSIAGTLKNYIFTHPVATITNLTISGNLDARDVQFICDSMDILEVLDISNTTIIEYKGREGTQCNIDTIYPANEMPRYSFYFVYNPSSPVFFHKKSPPLTTVFFPSNLTSIGDYAFFDSDLEGILELPDSLIIIKQNAFGLCSNLTDVRFPQNLTFIDYQAFIQCSGLTGILHFPDSLVSIGTAVFKDCVGLMEVSFPLNLTSIADYAFAGCTGLTDILKLPDNLNYVDAFAFFNCSNLTQITFSQKITTIGKYAFMRCSSLAGSLELPDNLITIEEAAFRNCTGLEQLIFPTTLKTIESESFYNCNSLKKITNPNPIPISIDSSVFSGVDKKACTLKIPVASIELYKSAPVWQDFFIEEEDTTNLKTIENPDDMLFVYPNPTTSQLQITNYGLRITDYKIYDVMGRNVYLFTRPRVHSSTIDIDISPLPAGIYFLQIQTKKEIITRKIIKE